MMIRKFGFARFAESANPKTPRPTTTDIAARPACCKNMRLLNILISYSTFLNVPERSDSEIIIPGNREFVI
jgi:hypothetical protein